MRKTKEQLKKEQKRCAQVAALNDLVERGAVDPEDAEIWKQFSKASGSSLFTKKQALLASRIQVLVETYVEVLAEETAAE